MLPADSPPAETTPLRDMPVSELARRSADTQGGSLGALKIVNDWFFENFGLQLFPKELYDLAEVPYRIEVSWVAQVMLAALLLSLVVAYFPARRAARMHPVKTLSYE